MDGRMKRSAIAFTIGALAAVSVARAQALADPTRPPDTATAETTTGSQSAPASRLQSVLVSSGRKIAVIDGTPYRLGEKVGEARVVRITETEVVLKSGSQSETLRMLPAVEKKPVRQGSAADESKGRRR